MQNRAKKETDWRFQVEASFVRDSTLSTEARLLYVIIKSFAGPNCENPFPSLATLSRHMGKHRVTIQKYLNELELNHWIERTRIKDKGKFASTRYALRDRSQRSSLRIPATTLDPTSKRNQFKEEPPSERRSKETKGTPPSGSVLFSCDLTDEEHEATWKPMDLGSKEAQLKRIKPPSDYPSEAQFEEFLVNEDLYHIMSVRAYLYEDLCDAKWHQWKPDQGKDGRWRLIRDWRSYVAALNQTIKSAAGS